MLFQNETNFQNQNKFKIFQIKNLNFNEIENQNWLKLKNSIKNQNSIEGQKSIENQKSIEIVQSDQKIYLILQIQNLSQSLRNLKVKWKNFRLREIFKIFKIFKLFKLFKILIKNSNLSIFVDSGIFFFEILILKIAKNIFPCFFIFIFFKFFKILFRRQLQLKFQWQ